MSSSVAPEIEGFAFNAEITRMGLPYLSYTALEHSGVQLVLSQDGIEALSRQPDLGGLLAGIGGIICRHANGPTHRVRSALTSELAIQQLGRGEDRSEAHLYETTSLPKPEVIKSYAGRWTHFQYFVLGYIADKLAHAEPPTQPFRVDVVKQHALITDQSGAGVIVMEKLMGTQTYLSLRQAAECADGASGKDALRSLEQLSRGVREWIAFALGPVAFRFINDLGAKTANLHVENDGGGLYPNRAAPQRTVLLDQPATMATQDIREIQSIVAALGFDPL